MKGKRGPLITRWDELAVRIIDALDELQPRLPTVEDARYFEWHERVLVESVRKRAEALVSRCAELDPGRVVEGGA